MTKLTRLPIALCWLFEWGLWLIFTDNTGVRELLAGAAAAAIVTYFSLAFASRKPVASFRIPHGIRVIWRLPAELAHDTALLLLALGQRLAGRPLRRGLVAMPFAAVGDNPASRGKRALATTLLTITPNTLVLGILKDEKIMLFHRLWPAPASLLAQQLSARAVHSA